MGLFGSSKKEEKEELPPLQFPELPKTVPAYEPEETLSDVKKSVSPSDIPIKPAAPSHHEIPAGVGIEQPLFVKIEKYKQVIDTLGKLKGRLSEAENILNKLNRLKDEEDRELVAWQNDLEKIRGQLMDIDKKLFE